MQKGAEVRKLIDNQGFELVVALGQKTSKDIQKPLNALERNHVRNIFLQNYGLPFISKQRCICAFCFLIPPQR